MNAGGVTSGEIIGDVAGGCVTGDGVTGDAKLRIREAIVVEGRYDKNTLSQAVDTLIIETAGFGVFSDKDKLNLIRRVADKTGVIILTDSDGAGFVIRNFLKNALKQENIKQAYVPAVFGKEKRKNSPSKSGLLGVEGFCRETIVNALLRAGATVIAEQSDGENKPPVSRGAKITKADLYAAGLSGHESSAQRRAELLRRMDLPELLSANSLIDVLNALITAEEFRAMTSEY